MVIGVLSKEWLQSLGPTLVRRTDDTTRYKSDPKSRGRGYPDNTYFQTRRRMIPPMSSVLLLVAPRLLLFLINCVFLDVVLVVCPKERRKLE